jgi:hypothetical protein
MDETETATLPVPPDTPTPETTPPERRGRCAATKKDGTYCVAKNRKGSLYCFHHDPKCAEERTKRNRKGAQTQNMKGARRRANEQPPEPLNPSTVREVRFRAARDVAELLSEVATMVLRRQIDVRTASCVRQVCGTALRAVQPDEATRLLEAVRNEIEEMKTNANHTERSKTDREGLEILSANDRAAESGADGDDSPTGTDYGEGGDDAGLVAIEATEFDE